MKLQPSYVIFATPHPEHSYTFWNCPTISNFWAHVNSVLSDLLEISCVPNPAFCLLNDTSDTSLKLIKCYLLGSCMQRKQLQNTGLHLKFV